MRYIYYIVLALCASLMSCGNLKDVQDEPAFWGKTTYYSPFLGKRCEPFIMEKTLELNFNDDARRLFTGEAVLELMMVQDDSELQSTVGKMKLYKNDDICDQNRLTLNINDSIVRVGIEILPELNAERYYTLYLVTADKGGLDIIDKYELDNCGFVVEKEEIMNPLAKLTMWIGIVMAALFAGWLMLSRMINPNLKFSRISFDYNNGVGELSHRVGGCYKVICTDKPKRISLLHKIFIGNVYVEVNEFWVSEMTIMCGSRNALRLITRGEYLLPDEPVRKEPFTIEDERQRKVNIETT